MKITTFLASLVFAGICSAKCEELETSKKFAIKGYKKPNCRGPIDSLFSISKKYEDWCYSIPADTKIRSLQMVARDDCNVAVWAYHSTCGDLYWPDGRRYSSEVGEYPVDPPLWETRNATEKSDFQPWSHVRPVTKPDIGRKKATRLRSFKVECGLKPEEMS